MIIQETLEYFDMSEAQTFFHLLYVEFRITKPFENVKL